MTREHLSTADAGEPRRWRRPGLRLSTALAAVASLVAVSFSAATPSQAADQTCTSTLSETFIFGNVVVPETATCTVSRVLITGSLDVRGNGAVTVHDSTVIGGLDLGTDAVAFLNGTTVGGRTNLTGAWALEVTGSALIGPVTITDAAYFLSEGTRHATSVTTHNTLAFVADGQIGWGLRTSGGTYTTLLESAVAGGVSASAPQEGALVCQSTIAGDLAVSGSPGIIQIGGEEPVEPECGSNVVTGRLQLHDNTGSDIQVAQNLVIGGASCTGNATEPYGANNLFVGAVSGQCTALNGRSPSTLSTEPLLLTPDDVRAEIDSLRR